MVDPPQVVLTLFHSPKGDLEGCNWALVDWEHDSARDAGLVVAGVYQTPLEVLQTALAAAYRHLRELHM